MSDDVRVARWCYCGEHGEPPDGGGMRINTAKCKYRRTGGWIIEEFPFDLSSYPYHVCKYMEQGQIVELPCKHCKPGHPCAEARGVHDQFPGSDADVHIQWKGTEVCIDFHCPCWPDSHKYAAHYDGFFAYYLQCPNCNAIYEMGTQVKARRLGATERPDMAPKMLDED